MVVPRRQRSQIFVEECRHTEHCRSCIAPTQCCVQRRHRLGSHHWMDRVVELPCELSQQEGSSLPYPSRCLQVLQGHGLMAYALVEKRLASTLLRSHSIRQPPSRSNPCGLHHAWVDHARLPRPKAQRCQYQRATSHPTSTSVQAFRQDRQERLWWARTSSRDAQF